MFVYLLLMIGLFLHDTTTAFVPSHQRIWSKREGLTAIPASTTDIASLIEQHGLTDRFGRWRYLQSFLDEEQEMPLQILSFVLRRALEENDPSSEEALSQERQDTIRELFPDDPRLVAEGDASIPSDKLDILLPDEYDEEDAYKSLWDIVKELHGASAVGMDLRDPSWCERCAVARLLIHHDFLFRGLQ